MFPYDPYEGPITGSRVQRWESSLEPIVLHIQFWLECKQCVWVTEVNKISPANDYLMGGSISAGSLQTS
ncbi:hypothetical protein HanXRQr2_Chr11g0512221 [Helianthus annuus]|uniref:Uncharacterized protein n=1 Tax=Helianthus annuus TaxID=4232 RepID=A0A9K3N1R7_HELAN|nr:hypothetical protein HanXRQr2_Chr11g0512221 [Helianthus annuus]KAJ0503082.1 hypothetical protein HanHA300_Chr11g0420191 [Helianthus annuus]KAJ0519048.1 hypothetical protein HanHA89_Chr11g0444241 [Helianthus annuus]KAJ0687044.1 hypothetical protein HanLR1_Chr11g0421491 [Helianthus annuus]